MKSINLKNMKETIVNYSECQSEFDKIWNTFYEMACLEYISQDTWKKFFEQCKGWYVDETNAEIRDSEQDDKIIWKYNPETFYHA